VTYEDGRTGKIRADVRIEEVAVRAAAVGEASL
jgi:hypothetical protein